MSTKELIEQRQKAGLCIICGKDITAKLSTGETKVIDSYIICKRHVSGENND